MTTILDVHLCAHNQRLENKVVLITGERDAPQCTPPSFSHSSHRYAGGAAGIGRETALQYARSKCVFAFESQSSSVDECAEH